MAENKNSIIFYRDWKEIFESLSDKDCAELIRHIFKYVNDENPKTENKIVSAVFIPIKNTLKRDLKKWENIRERNKVNGSKGGRPNNPKKPKKPNGLLGNPKKPKKPVSVSVSVTVSEEIFNNFRLLYPGTKLGNKTEFDNLRKKHKDWNEVVPLLLPALNNQITARMKKTESKLFVPEWKNLSTWINKRCWEEEIESVKPKPKIKPFNADEAYDR